MSAYQHYEIACDHEGCTETYNIAEKTARATRQSAANRGWVHGIINRTSKQGPAKAVDYCDAHAGDLGDVEPVYGRPQ